MSTRTLVYHAGALGDFVTVFPALEWYRRQHPGVSMSYLGRKAHGELGVAAGLFDNWRDVDAAAMSTLFAPPDGRPVPALTGFDEAVLFCADDSPLLTRCRAQIPTICQQAPFPADTTHVVDYHARLFDGPGGMIPVIDVASTACASEAEGMVVVHPGSGSPRKNWPEERFAAVAERFPERGCGCVWLLGPAEAERKTPGAHVCVIRELSLVDLAALLKRCAAFVGNDSGVSHLAAATGCPVVGIFGPTDPRVWAPRGRCVQIVRAADGSIDGVGVAEVLSALDEAMGGGQ